MRKTSAQNVIMCVSSLSSSSTFMTFYRSCCFFHWLMSPHAAREKKTHFHSLNHLLCASFYVSFAYRLLLAEAMETSQDATRYSSLWAHFRLSLSMGCSMSTTTFIKTFQHKINMIFFLFSSSSLLLFNNFPSSSRAVVFSSHTNFSISRPCLTSSLFCRSLCSWIEK